MKATVWFFGLALIAGALFVTKPDRKAFEDYLQTEMISTFDAVELDENDDPLATLVYATCKLARSSCYSLIRAFVEVEFTDLVFASRFDIRLDQDTARCLGFLKQIYCSDT